jgi:serine/threonine protein kinase
MAKATSSIFAPFKMVICSHTCAFTESPSGGCSIEAVVNQIRRWPTPNVVVASQHRASEMLKQLLDHALAKSPDDRIGNATELFRQLEVIRSELTSFDSDSVSSS